MSNQQFVCVLNTVVITFPKRPWLRWLLLSDEIILPKNTKSSFFFVCYFIWILFYYNMCGCVCVCVWRVDHEGQSAVQRRIYKKKNSTQKCCSILFYIIFLLYYYYYVDKKKRRRRRCGQSRETRNHFLVYFHWAGALDAAVITWFKPSCPNFYELIPQQKKNERGKKSSLCLILYTHTRNLRKKCVENMNADHLHPHSDISRSCGNNPHAAKKKNKRKRKRERENNILLQITDWSCVCVCVCEYSPGHLCNSHRVISINK